ncbi:MAG: hypothetical protein IPO23_12180 [Flavobacterium sp.]|nr:hypothetical protein [Flavobacterium sp.]
MKPIIPNSEQILVNNELASKELSACFFVLLYIQEVSLILNTRDVHIMMTAYPTT